MTKARNYIILEQMFSCQDPVRDYFEDDGKIDGVPVSVPDTGESFLDIRLLVSQALINDKNKQ